MTYWQGEDDTHVPYQVPDDVVDLVFRLRGSSIPVDHAVSLNEQLSNILPKDVMKTTGVHPVRVAESGNGWQRPSGADTQIHLSRRTKLVLRAQAKHLSALRKLSGSTIHLGENSLTIGDCKIRKFSTLPTLFSHGVASAEDLDESEFIEWAATNLQSIGIRVRKLLCGTSHTLNTEAESILIRSLMVADLKPDESIRLQQTGLGSLHELGCGIFIPHKGIDPIQSPLE